MSGSPQHDPWAERELFKRLVETTGRHEASVPVEQAVAEAIQRAFLAETVVVAWFVSRDGQIWSFDGGSSLHAMFAPATTPSAVHELPSKLVEPILDKPLADGIRGAVQSTDDTVVLQLGWASDDARHIQLRAAFHSLVDTPYSSAAERYARIHQGLRRSEYGLARLAHILRPLRRLAHEKKVATTRAELEAWQNAIHWFDASDERDDDSRLHQATAHLQQAADLLARLEISELDRLRIARSILHIVQEALQIAWTAGWRTAHHYHPARRARHTTQLVELVEVLSTIKLDTAVGSVPAPPKRRELNARLKILHTMLVGLSTPLEAHDGQPSRFDAAFRDLLNTPVARTPYGRDLHLLAIWLFMYEAAWSQTTGAQHAPARAHWIQVRDMSRMLMPRVLAEWATPASAEQHGHDHTGAIRNWLTLWFTHHQMPWTVDTHTVVHWQMRRAIARVVCETFRARLFGRSARYRIRTEPLTDALRALVREHIGGSIPQMMTHDTNGLLNLIADDEHPRGPRFGSAHLQHVLDIYIAGHFFLSTRVCTDDSPYSAQPTVARVLSDDARGPYEARDEDGLLTVWTLAALYHDAGLAIFTESGTARATLQKRSPAVQAGVETIQAALGTGTQTLLSQIVATLTEKQIIQPQSPEAEWAARQLQSGRPDHALTGAWHLLCEAEAAGSIDAHRYKAATRAILLHAAHTVPIDPSADPVASLLVLCDTLFDWNPGSVKHGSLGATRPSERNRHSRTAALRFPQLQIQVSSQGALECFFDLRPPTATDTRLRLDNGQPAWPVVELTHTHPDELGQMVFPVWLDVAQNICRLVPTSVRFTPLVEVRGLQPTLVRTPHEGTTGILNELIYAGGHPTLTGLRPWFDARLHDGQPTSATTVHDHRTPSEMRRIFPIGQVLTRADLRTSVMEIRQAIERHLDAPDH